LRRRFFASKWRRSSRTKDILIISKAAGVLEDTGGF
jgi:hypothetical protein